MTKKDYEKFANEIYNSHEKGSEGYVYKSQAVEHLVNICIKIFSKDNPLFQADKFEQACYEGKHIRKSIKGA